MNIRQKVRIKMQQTSIDILLYQTFVGANRLFALSYSYADGHAKRYKSRRYYLPKGVIKN